MTPLCHERVTMILECVGAPKHVVIVNTSNNITRASALPPSASVSPPHWYHHCCSRYPCRIYRVAFPFALATITRPVLCLLLSPHCCRKCGDAHKRTSIYSTKIRCKPDKTKTGSVSDGFARPRSSLLCMRISMIWLLFVLKRRLVYASAKLDVVLQQGKNYLIFGQAW